jgi:hypothetical protein
MIRAIATLTAIGAITTVGPDFAAATPVGAVTSPIATRFTTAAISATLTPAALAPAGQRRLGASFASAFAASFTPAFAAPFTASFAAAFTATAFDTGFAATTFATTTAATVATTTSSATATAVATSAAFTAPAIVVFTVGGFTDCTARTRDHAHAERPRPETQETTRALLHHRDHGLGARQSQGLQTLAHRFIESFAFERRTCRPHREPLAAGASREREFAARSAVKRFGTWAAGGAVRGCWTVVNRGAGGPLMKLSARPRAALSCREVYLSTSSVAMVRSVPLVVSGACR